jgi:hypothetical protein
MSFRPRLVLPALAAAAALLTPAAATASSWMATNSPLSPARIAAEPQPMTGTGENMRLVANVPLEGDEESPAASDIELAGDYAFVGSYGEGMVVIDIADPTHPRRAGKFDCPGGQNDIQLSPDATVAVMAIDTKSNTCHDGQEGSVVLDISDPANPRELSFIPIQVGSHNDTLDWPYLYVDNYPTSYHKLEVFDLSTPTVPRKIGEYDYGDGSDGIHDSYVDHRPDGRDLLYAASIGHTDVLDVTDPSHPKLELRFSDPSISISHQAEPNFDRTALLVTDEFLGGNPGPAACGGTPLPFDPPALPETGRPNDIGALHFFALNPDGSVKDGGPDGKIGTYNIPTQPNDPQRGCTIHVFWQAPAENRLVTAWYGRGTHIVDFSDPTNAKELGFFRPTNADTWAAKPHKGYIFTGDIVRGMDVLEYTGGGWPKTAGPAELQRHAAPVSTAPAAETRSEPAPASEAAGETAAPSATPAAPRTGVYRFTRRVRVPRAHAKRRTLTLTITDRRGVIVSRQRFRARSGRVARIRASAGGLEGAYRYVFRLGERNRRLASGSFTVTGDAASRVGLRPGQVLVCRLQV